MVRFILFLIFIFFYSKPNFANEKIVDPFEPDSGFGAKEISGGKINQLVKNGWEILDVTTRDNNAPVYHLKKKKEIIFCVVSTSNVKCFKP